MSKSLKEIVEEGFASLEQLAGKRKEFLSSLSEFSDSANESKCKMASDRFESAEAEFNRQVHEQASRSRDLLNQSLAQVIEDNERFLSSLRESLQLKIARILQELAHSRDWIQVASTEELESTFHPMERELEAGAAEIRTESVSFLGKLEAFCKNSQSSLHESQAEIAGKLSQSERDLISSLGASFNAIVEESQKRRQKSSESLRALYKEQSSKMDSLTEEMDKKISIIVGRNLETVRNLARDADKALLQLKDDVLTGAYTELVSASQESLTELKDSYEFSSHELSEKLNETQAEISTLIEKLREALNQERDKVKSSGEAFSDEIKNRPAESSTQSSAEHLLEEAGKQLARDLDSVVADLKRQVSELVRMQADRLTNLCSSAESAVSASATALNTELKQLSRLHEQNWSEREQDLLLRLRKVEKEAQDTYTRISGSLAQDNSAGSNGGQ